MKTRKYVPTRKTITRPDGTTYEVTVPDIQEDTGKKSPKVTKAVQGNKPNGLEALVSVMAHNTPGLEGLTADQLRTIGKAVIFDALKDTLKNKVDLKRMDYPEDKRKFLASLTLHTRKAYASGLDTLEDFARRHETTVPELTPAQVDDFRDELSGSPASVRLKLAGASAFYSYLERRHPEIIKRNPCRGMKRPKKNDTRALTIPTDAEIEATIENTKDKTLRAALVIMNEHGLRVGGLPTLKVHDGKFSVVTKGKTFTNKLPLSARLLSALDGLGREPFKDYSPLEISNAVKYQIRKAREKVKTKFSPHDIRHKFALREYAKDKDIVRVKNLLGHSNISITDTYLKTLETA